MIEKLRDHLSTTSSGEATVDMLEWIGHATLDVIGLVAFGHDFQCGDSTEAQAISASLDRAGSTGMELSGFVGPLIIRIFPWLLSLPLEAIQAQGAIRRIIREIALRIVRNREATQDTSGKDLLSVLLRMKSNSGMDLDTLLDQVSFRD